MQILCYNNRTMEISEELLDTRLGILVSVLTLVGMVCAAVAVMWKQLPRWGAGRWIVRTVRFVLGRTKKYDSVRDFAEDCLGSQEDVMKKVKESVRIVIVDDNPDNFPVKHLRDSNFQVDVKTSISLAEIDGLRAYDVVFLDIAGVLQEDLKNGGVKILQRLTDHSHTKHPVVIAISAQRFDIERGQFYKDAYDTVKQPIDAARCEDVLMDAVDPRKMARKLDAAVNEAQLSARQRESVFRHLVEYMKGERSWRGTQSKLNQQHWSPSPKVKIMADGVKRWVA